jgi:predicted secreted protein
MAEFFDKNKALFNKDVFHFIVRRVQDIKHDLYKTVPNSPLCAFNHNSSTTVSNPFQRLTHFTIPITSSTANFKQTKKTIKTR